MATKFLKRTLVLAVLVGVSLVLGKFHIHFGFWDGPVGG